jgi:hypothetical protein
MRNACITLLLAVALFASGQESQVREILDQPVSDSIRLRVSVVYPEQQPGVCCSALTRIVLIDSGNVDRPIEIATIPGESEVVVQRADNHSLVLSLADSDYGMDQGSIKLFFDTHTERLLKRIDFDTSHALEFRDDADAARTLGITPGAVRSIRQRGVLTVPQPNPFEQQLPEPFEAHPLPQSTYLEFARARPGRVRDGYGEKETAIKESVGAYQETAGRLWFGKVFYDGEGLTGVGAIGYLASGRYTLLRIPELFDWSVSGLLVEDDIVWAARVAGGEGATRSGGILRYDRKSQRVTVLDVPDAVHSIARVGDAVFADTNHGLYVIRGGTRTRFRAEPDIDGRFIVVRERLAPRP